ncbi:hypothetical protein EJB05_07999 [Eragrostis curvula]|uniref:WAT1-related protein n=1 Tax=Eragrostis curvula TaxID=38414 RepID=A0A5J9WK66_9POAL|nr:hypothetical protein EJB05_07999 [Eragrostis curvula]
MAIEMAEKGGVWSRYAPHILMTLAQLAYTLMYFITEAAFNRGLNPYVYITYRHLLVAVLIWPFAYYHEKKLRPKMTPMLFLEIFVLSLLGVSLTLNMYFASLKYTSPAFVTMEIVDVKNLRGLAKIAGTVVSFAGVTTMTLYKGAAITSLWKSPIHIPSGSSAHDGFVKGSILAIASCICWAVWYIMQASSLKRYPAQLSLTAWMCTVGGIQSTIFTVFMQHKPEDWLIGFGVKFWCIVYSGLACNGFTVFVQLWCTEKKGPVFVTMFNPLSTIMVAILAYFIFGENLYVGSIMGGVVVILGLYMLLWGKEKDNDHSAGKALESEVDCEKVSDVSAVRNEALKTMK